MSTCWTFDQPQPAEVRGEVRDSTTRIGHSHLCRSEMDWTQGLSPLPFKCRRPYGDPLSRARPYSKLEHLACLQPKRPKPVEVNHRQPKEQWHRRLLS